MDYRTSTPIEFRTKLGFNQHDLIMTKEQSVLTKIIKVLEREKILLQHTVLSYKIDLYFVEHKLAIEVDEKGHRDGDRYEEIEREKTTEKDVGCKLIGINLDEKDFDAYVVIGKIYNHINRSCEKSLIDKISKKTMRIRI